ncbi:putative protein serine/threonine kinase [Heterostelium album PN500]|uniref:non-specific serine/threonine protein kinase n=1 Tax=Heterostelium pallidum (strain ATCC 26659 / Pp 5 / PN500) TaxID=670386 RepID=D3AWL2_HETP5|nr:putative protein serine/threonine kinase [Heterostelium album PN500]EFA86685.1 putative protein serine/threonine kinase [Heterostelium album PN500]|eukprot:XP_020438789.1 putative protein serine/threonine kinase [Heterostelium album PN500]
MYVHPVKVSMNSIGSQSEPHNHQMHDMDMSMDMSMDMGTTGNTHHGAGSTSSFTFSVQVDLFGLLTSGWPQYCVAFVCVMGLSIAYEALLFAKQNCHRYFAHVGPDTDATTQLKFKISMTALHVLTAMFHYALMLIVMTFNFGMALSVLLGVAIGYSVFLEYPNRYYKKVQRSAGEKIEDFEYNSGSADHCNNTSYISDINTSDNVIFTLHEDFEDEAELNSKLNGSNNQNYAEIDTINNNNNTTTTIDTSHHDIHIHQQLHHHSAINNINLTSSSSPNQSEAIINNNHNNHNNNNFEANHLNVTISPSSLDTLPSSSLSPNPNHSSEFTSTETNIAVKDSEVPTSSTSASTTTTITTATATTTTTSTEQEIQDLIRHSTELMRKSVQLTQEYIEHIEQLSESENNNNNNNNNLTSNNKHSSNLDSISVENHPLANTNTNTVVEKVPISSEASSQSTTSRLVCKMHRSSYLMTQLGGIQMNSSIDELLSEKNPDSGMGYREPGPQGFLSYVNLDPNQPLSSQTIASNNSSSQNISSTSLGQQQHQQPHHQQQQQFGQHQQHSNGSLSGYMNSSNSANEFGNILRSSSNNLNLNKVRVASSQSAINLSGSGNGFPSASGVSRSVSMLKSEEGKRKSVRQNRMAKNEDDRRKRKEQKRARAKEKPIYVGSLEELPPECIKMIRKSKIPEDKLKEHFEILLPILRFRTGFNLKSSNPLSKSSLHVHNNQVTSMTMTSTTTTSGATSSQHPLSPETNGSRTRSESKGAGGNASSKIETHNNGGNEDDSADDGSRLEQSIIPKGTTELFEKGDVKKLYKNLKQIGSGGFGSVYLAKSLVDKCEIAIKKIAHTTPKAQRTNLNEIGYLHFCNHSNVVRYLRSHLVDDQVWIAMEYMQGGTLTEACSNHSFNESCIAYVARGMLEGLKYLHSNNLVHRDIKSGNIMMTIEGKIKIVDFGLCVDSTERKLTHMAGSPFWMSPEMIRGEGYGCPSDLWSFGICLLELANGEPPNRKSSLHAMFSIATHTINGHTGLERPEKWTEHFRHFLTLCLEVDPAKRQTAEQLLTHPWLTISENPETMKKILAQIFIANCQANFSFYT